jgi:extracellular factor (EF) 3-hydroxypalmitic acid methyl ester biosynthesis protein
MPRHWIGRTIYDWEMTSKSCRSVRERRSRLAGRIDELADAHGKPSILSIACGHLREGQISGAVRDRRIRAFWALDQDTESLGTVAREQPEVRVVKGSVRSLLAGGAWFPPVDFVYAAGLYDYLDASTAARLTAKMFSLLAPGGRLLVANFAKDHEDAGYMEAVMGWWLIYREEADMESLAGEIAPEEIAWRHVYRDKPESVVYLELTRRR